MAFNCVQEVGGAAGASVSCNLQGLTFVFLEHEDISIDVLKGS